MKNHYLIFYRKQVPIRTRHFDMDIIPSICKLSRIWNRNFNTLKKVCLSIEVNENKWHQYMTFKTILLYHSVLTSYWPKLQKHYDDITVIYTIYHTELLTGNVIYHFHHEDDNNLFLLFPETFKDIRLSYEITVCFYSLPPEVL